MDPEPSEFSAESKASYKQVCLLNSISKKTVISIPINWDNFVFLMLSNINLMEAGGAEENEQM